MKSINFYLRLFAIFGGILFILSSTPTGAQTCAPAPVGLVSWYEAESNALDSRSRNNGNWNGTAAYNSGKVGQAFGTGALGGSISVPHSPSLTFTNNLSVEAWINPSTPNNAVTYSSVIDKGYNAGGAPGFNLSYLTASQQITFGIGQPGNETFASAPITLNTFTHVVGTYDGATVRLYLNGALAASQPTSIASLATNNFNMTIGSSTSFNNPFNGLIDEASLYNRALSAAEIAAIYAADSAGKCKPTATAAPSGQVGWFAADGNAGDTSGNSNNGVLNNGTGFAVGKVGQAFSFDGVDDWIEVANNASLEPDSITIEGWIKPQVPSTSTLGGFIYSLRQPFNYESFSVYVTGSGKLSIVMGTTSTASTVASVFETAANAVQFGAFQHFAATYNHTNGALTAYLNGAPVALTNVVGPGVLSGAIRKNNIKAIGRRQTPATPDGQSGAGQYLGLIDELGVYNRALAPGEIQSIFNAGKAGKLKQTVSSGTIAAVGDVTVAFSSAAARTTQEIPLEESDLPPLPSGTSTGLTYDVATSPAFTGTATVCFNLPALASIFPNLRIYHLEGGVWVDRTASSGNTVSNFCTVPLSSLSPFAIVQVAPTAATVFVSGRVTSGKSFGASRAIVSLTDAEGNVKSALVNQFGYYRFDDIAVGQTVTVEVTAKGYSFAPQVVTVNEAIEDLNFSAQ